MEQPASLLLRAQVVPNRRELDDGHWSRTRTMNQMRRTTLQMMRYVIAGCDRCSCNSVVIAKVLCSGGPDGRSIPDRVMLKTA